MIIGITGGIGSGKSTIARELARRGFAVYDCDIEAKRIVAEDKEIQSAIIALLGKAAFVNGQYNTAYVAQRVFAEPVLLDKLNHIIHPEVAKDIIHKQPDFVESAILYDSGLNTLCEKIIVIEAPEDVCVARTIARDYHGIASEENINKVRARIRNQHASICNPSLDPDKTLILLNDGNASIGDLVEKITHWM